MSTRRINVWVTKKVYRNYCRHHPPDVIPRTKLGILTPPPPPPYPIPLNQILKYLEHKIIGEKDNIRREMPNLKEIAPK